MGNIWNLTIQLLEVVFLFGLVLALAYVSTRFLGRKLISLGSSRHLRLLDQLPLGSNRSVFLIEVQGRVFLVGSAEGGVSLLGTFDDPETVKAMVEAVPPGNSGSFKAKLEQLLSRDKINRSTGGSESGPEVSDLPPAVRDSLRRLRELKRNGERDD